MDLKMRKEKRREEKRREKNCSSNALESFDLQTGPGILANFAFNLLSL